MSLGRLGLMLVLLVAHPLPADPVAGEAGVAKPQRIALLEL